jgi:hypothetical protein
MQPSGSEARRARIASRSRRFTRLRATAGPTARLTTKPTFAGSPARTPPGGVTGTAAAALPAADGGISMLADSNGPPAWRPVRSTSRKSSGRRILQSRGSKAVSPCGPEPMTPSGAQPRAPLGTTRRDDGPASPGTHAQPEAMDLRPAAVVRLERTLAHWSSTVTGQFSRAMPRGPVPGRPRALLTRMRHLRVSLLTVRAITVQVKPGPGRARPARPAALPSSTARFPRRFPLRRLRLWKTSVHRCRARAPRAVAAPGGLTGPPLRAPPRASRTGVDNARQATRGERIGG